MPIYQYKCKTCSDIIEVQQSFTDDSLTESPDCMHKDSTCELKKVFSAINIAFKGEGFYKNDSGSNQKPSTTPSESTTSSKSTSSDSKSDSSTTSTKSETPKPSEKASNSS